MHGVSPKSIGQDDDQMEPLIGVCLDNSSITISKRRLKEFISSNLTMDGVNDFVVNPARYE